MALSNNFFQPPANTGSGLKQITFEQTTTFPGAGTQTLESQGAVITDPVEIGRGANVVVLNGQNLLKVAAGKLDGQRVTYMGAAPNLALATAATDVFTIAGFAATNIRILKLIAYIKATTAAAFYDAQVIKRSALDTGGTSTGVTAVPMQSTDAAAVGTVLQYTANPTLGTAVGSIAAATGFAPLDSAAGPIVPIVFDFGDDSGKAATLVSATQQLALNLSGGLPNGGHANIYIRWTEGTD